MEDDGVLGAVTLQQEAIDPLTGHQELRPHRMRLGLYDTDSSGALVRTESIDVDVAGPSTLVTDLNGKRRPALLLVNDDDLSYVKVRLDPESEHTVRTSLDKISDPMARALCWTALWDSARDGVTPPAARYVSAVEQFATSETGIGVLLNVLGNAASAIERYVASETREAVRKEFLAVAAEQLMAAAPGSDSQLAWARTLADVSRHGDSQLTLVRESWRQHLGGGPCRGRRTTMEPLAGAGGPRASDPGRAGPRA